MTTRKELITKKYLSLISQLNEFIPASIFPSLDEIDLVDVIFLFNLCFKNESSYKASLKDLIELKNVAVSDAQLNQIYDIVLPFIVWLKALQ